MTARARRLLTARMGLVSLYWLCLPWPWYANGFLSGLFGSSPPVKTGWEMEYGRPGLWLVAGLAVAVLRSRVPSKLWIRVVVAMSDIGLGITALLSFFFTGFLIIPVAPSPAYEVATASFLAAALLVLGRFGPATTSVNQSASARPPTPGDSLRPQPERPDASELVLIVHGTGSAALADLGSGWWQAGGSLASALDRHLPEHLRSHRAGEVFHWSGANIESQRRAAGRALAAHLRALFPLWNRIHVVAHSHGGSVAWHAIRELHAEDGLARVGTVVTIGAPYLRLQPAIGLLYPALALVIVAGLFDALRAPLMDAVGLGEQVWLTVPGVTVAVTLAVLMVITLFLLLYLACALAWRGRCTIEHRADVAAWNAMRGRLRCVWSRHDEAINGLSAAIAVGGGVLVADKPAKPKHLAIWRVPLATLYEDIVGPILDQAIWLRTTRRLQGIDLLGARFDAAMPHPVDREAALRLPDPLSVPIDDWVAAHASTTLRRARESLGVFWATDTSVGQLTGLVSEQLNGNELVHWAYYQAPGMPEFIGDLLLRPESFPAAEPVLQGTPAPPLRTRPWAVASLAAIGTLAFSAMATWGLVSTWHRLAVYALTDRYSVAAALKSAPIDSALEQLAIDSVARWFAVRGEPGPTSTRLPKDPDGYLLMLRSVESMRRARGLFLSGASDGVFDRACSTIYSGALDGLSPAQIRSDLAALYSPRSPNGLSAEQITEPLTDELVPRLKQNLGSFMRTCVSFRPETGFFLPLSAWEFRLIGSRRAEDDNYLGAAIYLARAWALDSAIVSELGTLATAPPDCRACSLTGPQRSATFGRADAWALPDLIRVLALAPGAAANAATVHLMKRAMEEDSTVSRKAAVEVACGLPNAVRQEVKGAIGGEASPLWAAAEARCLPPSAASDGADAFEILERITAYAVHDSATVVERAVLLNAGELDSARVGTIRLSWVCGDAAVLLARGGWSRDALDMAKGCPFARDRLRGLTEILVSFRQRHPALSFEDIVAEARDLATADQREGPSKWKEVQQ